MLKFEDFAKLDIKIGIADSAERVEGTDRLLKVVVDMGDEKRQVIAGFGHQYKPEDLVGKQVPIVLNIEPAKIRGVDSHGIFMAIDAHEPVLLIPDKKVDPGSKVK